MPIISFADVVHQNISFNADELSHAIALALIDTPWVQRLRDISQTANTRLVYMFAEHSRFGHCVGVAYLANLVMDKLALHYPAEIAAHRTAVSAAALLHDIGHIAPGSHTAYKTWFPDEPDTHEEVSARIIHEDVSLQKVLSHYGSNLAEKVVAILAESDSLPPWTWELISGGGWNVDRGNWCIVDSVMAGVSYGKYNIPALTESIVIANDGHLALNENRLDAMMHFAISRHAMYRQIYQHRVILAADTLNTALVLRARALGDKISFADDVMRAVLHASSPADLSLQQIFCMREHWWRYHVLRWSQGSDPILAELSNRILNRQLFKTVRVREEESFSEIFSCAREAVERTGFDPRYYLHSVTTLDMHANDFAQSMQVLLDDGSVKSLGDAEPLFNAMVKESRSARKVWIVLPQEAKTALGRLR